MYEDQGPDWSWPSFLVVMIIFIVIDWWHRRNK